MDPGELGEKIGKIVAPFIFFLIGYLIVKKTKNENMEEE